MVNDTSLITRLQEEANTFSKNQRALAKFIAGNYQTVAFSTITELAGQSGISEATIVRFAKALDFSGYPAFQREIRRLVRAELKGTERFRLTYAHGEPADGPLKTLIAKELENIAGLEDVFDPEAFHAAIRWLRDANNILVVGSRSTSSLANHLWFGLNKIAYDADRVLAISSDTYDRLDRMDKGSCLIVIGFPRYLRELVEICLSAKKRKIPTITITDSPFSPLQGDVSLYAPAESASFVAFHSAPLILINALLNELSLSNKDRTLDALNRFEALADNEGYFHQD